MSRFSVSGRHRDTTHSHTVQQIKSSESRVQTNKHNKSQHMTCMVKYSENARLNFMHGKRLTPPGLVSLRLGFHSYHHSKAHVDN